jgi:hypothetical protein
MTMLDTASDTVPSDAPPPVPTLDEAFPDEPAPKAPSREPRADALPGAAAAGEKPLPTLDEAFPDTPPPRPITGALAPGPFGDFVFGDTKRSSLARIMEAFGAGVVEAFPDKLDLSDETQQQLRDFGIFNDYVKGHHSLLKAFNETLLRHSAVAINTAFYGVPAIIHGGQEAVMEAGTEAENTAIGRAIRSKQLARAGAGIPEAFPDFNFHTQGIMVRPRLPEPLAKARDLNVIGPGGEAAWKGVAKPAEAKPGVAGAAAEGAEGAPLPEIRVEAAAPAEAAPPDIHAAARALDPKTFGEYDTLTARRDLFRNWLDELDASERPDEDAARVAGALNETEARIAELAPAVADAYRTAEARLPEGENVGDRTAAPAAGDTAAAAAAAAATGREAEAGAPAKAEAAPGAVPAEGGASARLAGEAGAQAEVKPPRKGPAIDIAADVSARARAAGRSEAEAAADGAIEAAYWRARAARFDGAKGTAEEMYERESPEVLKAGQRSQERARPRAPRKVDEDKLSLLPFLAHHGGLQETPDLRHILDRNPFIPGFGRLFRRTGMTEDRARALASEAGFLPDEAWGEKTTIKDLHALIRDEAHGTKRWRIGREPEPEPVAYDEEEAAAYRASLAPEGEAAPYESELMAAADWESFGADGRLLQEGQAPPFYSAVARVIDGAKQNKASPEQWLGMLKNMPGVKPEEMEWLGLGDWLKGQKGSVTKEQIADYVRANEIEVHEVMHEGAATWTVGDSGGRWPVEYASEQEAHQAVRDNARQMAEDTVTFRERRGRGDWQVIEETANGDDVRTFETEEEAREDYEDTLDYLTELYVGDARVRQSGEGGAQFTRWTLPGGANQRELVLTLPPKAGEPTYRVPDAHAYSDSASNINRVAHVRFNDRTIGGKKTLFVEEVQSDWHQKGKKAGYRSAALDSNLVATQKEGYWEVTRPDGEFVTNVFAHEETTADGAVAEARRRLANVSHKVPDAPFKTTWPELAMKRMIRYAADHSYDQIAWTGGETQAERYGLAAHINALDFERGNDGTYVVSATDKGGQSHTLSGTAIPEAKLPEYVGQEMADKIAAHEAPSGSFKGLDLKVGGEGMAGFYDQILPATVNKLVKKFGGKVESASAQVPDDRDIPFIVRDRNGTVVGHGIQDENFAAEEAARVGGSYEFDDSFGAPVPVHAVAITPELRRAAVEQGFPLFQDQAAHRGRLMRGSLDINPSRVPGRAFIGVEGVRSVMRMLRDANASTFLHESAHDWLARMLRDSMDERAPADLKADAATVLDWLGVNRVEDVGRTHHERFARAFEVYMMEGRAPSQALAAVFAKFKAWLIGIYHTVAGIEREARFKVPINDAIRGVFDRLLATPDEIAARDTVIAPERERPPGLGERHEARAEATEPPQAHGVAEDIQGERDSIGAQNLVEGEHARLENVDPETRRREAGTQEPPGHATEGWRSREAGHPPQHGDVGPGGNQAAPEGAGASAGVGRGAKAVATGGASELTPGAGPNTRFSTGSNLIDKAGNIRLDKLNQPDDIDDVIREAARRNNNFRTERRYVISDGEALVLSEALGRDPAFLDRKKIGDAYNEEEINAAKTLLIQSAAAVRNAFADATSGDEAALRRLAELIARHEMIQGKVAGATAEWGRAGRALRRIHEGADDAAALNALLKAETGRELYQLAQMAKYGATLTTPARVSRFIFETSNGKLKRAVVFYYINALISGPITHARYAAGNALTALWSPLVKTPIAAGLSAAVNAVGMESRERVYLGEAGAELYGLLKGSREGWKAGVEGWQTGNTPALPGEGAPDLFGAQPMMPPIPGALGAIISSPGKAVGFIHGFSSAVRYEQEIHRLAYRAAMQEGRTGDAFAGRVGDLTNRPTPEMMEKAAAVARKDLYMAPTDYDSLAGKLTRTANHSVFTKILVPFMKIGTQITRNALIEGTPLGIFDRKVRANLSGANGAAARDLQAANIVGGMALMGTMVMMTAEGLATGDGPPDPEQRAVWLLSHTPNHLTIGPISIPYQGLGAIGMQMRLAANTYESAHGWGEDEHHAAALDFLYGFEKAVLDENFMRGIKDMIDAGYHSDEYFDRYAAGMVTNWMPFSVGLGQVNRAFVDPYQRETRDETLLGGIRKEAMAKVPLMSQMLKPRRDMFGEPIPSSGPLQSYANDRVVRAMNDLDFKVGRLEHKIKGVTLTDEQYDDYARIAGRTAKMHLDRTVRMPGFDKMLPNARKELMHLDIKTAREDAAKQVMMASYHTANDIIAKAIENTEIKKGIKAPPPAP